MKKQSLFSAGWIFLSGLVLFFSACKKINEATELGDELVPPVDNITTFDTTLSTETNNALITDSTNIAFGDNLVLGTITNDAEFGRSKADIFFDISAPSYGTYPFTSKTDLQIDSVILSLSYVGSYGDTNAVQTARVYEIAQSSRFTDTTLFKLTDATFETTGVELGAKSFSFKSLRDSIAIVRRDTAKTANVLRIRLANSLGERLASYDTVGATPGYRNDAEFKKLFRGIAVKTDAGSGNGLGYFSISDAAKTRLIVYYRATKNNVRDTATVIYTHQLRTAGNRRFSGLANIITRNPGGNFLTSLTNSTAQDDKVYIQSAPGSYGAIKIPALNSFNRGIIHRAELLISRLPSISQETFRAPEQLFLDRLSAREDSAFVLRDLPFDNSQNPILRSFGGDLEAAKNRYVFNITSYVQDVITQKLPNSTLRVYAPFFTRPYFKPNADFPASLIPIQVAPQAFGRVVLAGGNFADPSLRMRVRIIYSKLQ